jgi:hypothetical protein
MPLPHPERLTQQLDRPGHTHPPDEGHPPGCQREPGCRHHEAPRQLPQPQSPPVLRRRLSPQSRMGMLRVDGPLQPRQFPPQITGPLKTALQQRLLEPDSVLSRGLF